MKQAMSHENIPEAKVVIIGSTTVGKTSITIRLIRSTFDESTSSTIGASFQSKTLEIDNNPIKLNIWDTGGSERYRAMAPMYYHDALAAVIVYDITSSESFDDVETWLKELLEKGSPNCLIALIGNKLDLESSRKVPTEKAKQYAAKNHIPIFMECSALSGDNINEVFTTIADNLIKHGGAPPKTNVVVGSTDQPAKNGCSC